MIDITRTLRTPYLVSVNSMYEPNMIWIRNKDGSRYQKFLGFRLCDDARRLKSSISDQLSKFNDKEKLKDIDWNYPFELTICYVLCSSVKKRDLNNLHKCVIDGIFEYFELNDSRIFSEHYYKTFVELEHRDHEYIKFNLKQLDKTYEEMKLKI